MPQFSYKAKAGPNQTKDGIIQAENKASVVKRLKEEGLYPISIGEVNVLPVKKRHKRITSSVLSDFTRRLANLIHSGFSLDTALSTLAQQEQNQGLKILIQDLQERIQKGLTFSSALKEYPEIFSSFYINMVSIGETSGKTDESLTRLADFKERETELVSQVKSALVYPGFLLTIGVITIFVMMIFFVPRFVTMFSNLNQELPIPTQIIIKISSFSRKFWWLILLASGLIYSLFKNYSKIEKNRLIIDGFFLHLPIIKDLIQRLEMARFSYAMGVLLKNGVPILEALDVVGLSVNNRVFRQSISGFREKIRKGKSLSSCLQENAIFPPVLVNSVMVGEESGELADMLLRIATIFENEANRTIKTLVSLVEPMLILFIGGFIVFVVILSIILPIFQMNLQIR